MDPITFVHSLQITDSFFPVGAFAYSDGLETAAAGGRVRDAASLAHWMNHFLEEVFVPCEGLALLKCMRALAAGDFQTLAAVDAELTAIRPAASVRAASAGVGKRLLSLYGTICGDERFAMHSQLLPHANAAAAYGLVFFHQGLAPRQAIMAFGYNRLAGIVSAALRLFSIGQQQGQMLLTSAVERLPDAAERIVRMAEEPLRSFNPVLDIQQMNHQCLYSRLFRS
jgi:urease accessory protein